MSVSRSKAWFSHGENISIKTGSGQLNLFSSWMSATFRLESFLDMLELKPVYRYVSYGVTVCTAVRESIPSPFETSIVRNGVAYRERDILGKYVVSEYKSDNLVKLIEEAAKLFLKVHFGDS